VDFLCEEMKVKIVLKFRGREMAHTEIGFQLLEKFLKDVAPYGHPDSTPKLLGRAITVMLSPLPRNKRAKNPRADAKPLSGLQKNSHPDGDPDSGHPLPPTHTEAGGPTAAAA
jgi:translation initiation factor IF-3